MKTKTIKLDFSAITNLSEMHEYLKKEFGFPDFYGANVNALIDCWTSLRFPEDGMVEITIEDNEVLLLEIKNLPSKSHIILNHFLIAIQAVNNRYTSKGKLPCIYLNLDE